MLSRRKTFVLPNRPLVYSESPPAFPLPGALAVPTFLRLSFVLLAMHQTGFRGRMVLASSMVVYGEGRFRCREHGIVRPGPRNSADLDTGRFEPVWKA